MVNNTPFPEFAKHVRGTGRDDTSLMGMVKRALPQSLYQVRSSRVLPLPMNTQLVFSSRLHFPISISPNKGVVASVLMFI